MVRAKFNCNSNEDGIVKFFAVTSGSEENDSFFEATPSGEILLQVVNEEAAKQFEVGKQYYVDFTLAEAPAEEEKTDEKEAEAKEEEKNDEGDSESAA